MRRSVRMTASRVPDPDPEARGSVLIASGGILGDANFRLHDLDQVLLLQGMFIGLAVGVGGDGAAARHPRVPRLLPEPRPDEVR